MKNFKPQKKHGTCGIYNLANILQNESILDYENDEKFIPCGHPEVNKILENEGYDIRLSALVNSFSHETVIPKDFFIDLISAYFAAFHKDKSSKGCVAPLIIHVQCGKSKFSIHAVSIIYDDGKILYSDPINDEFELLSSLDDIFTKGLYVNAVYGFTSIESMEYISINKKFLNLV